MQWEGNKGDQAASPLAPVQGAARPLAYNLYHLFWVALDWLYPPECGGCRKPGERWCPDCQAQIRLIRAPLCSICGEPQEHEGICSRCTAAPPPYRALRSCALFDGPLRLALHRLKYRQDVGLAEALSIHLIDLLAGLNWPIELITAVPLSANRMRKRGYNQARLLARPLALAHHLPYRPQAIRRTRDTQSQVGLSAKARLQNVSGAFCAQPDLVKGRTVLLIDDVATTGSTLQACCESLFQAGAVQVYGLTLARAGFRSSVQATGPVRADDPIVGDVVSDNLP